ncbi:MAG: cytochrome-c oxidase, cbb3-type subunit III, partial [Parvibaculum sp.]
MTDKHAKDEVSGTETTGHEWDGIRELDTPLPKWWVYVFYACIAWAVVYWFLLPAWPYFWDGAWRHTTGVMGYTQRNEVTDELAAVAAGRADIVKAIEQTPIDQVASNDSLMEVAMAGGKAAFGDNCAPCHGSGAAGAKGYPNLNDDDWLWGGTAEQIQQTITHGIRFASAADTRLSEMP